MIQKPNIKKYINDQPKQLINTHRSSFREESITDNPLFKIAQTYVENMDTKYKIAVATLAWIILSGIITNLYLIYKLIILTI